MKINKLLLFSVGIFLAISATSCDKNNTEIDGDWDDIIKLSTRSANFISVQSSEYIKTEKEWWWIEDVQIDNNHFKPEYKTNQFDKEFIAVNADWLTVERMDGLTLKLSVTPNLTQSERTAVITLQAGNYFDYITIKQAHYTASAAKLLPSVIVSTYGAIPDYHSVTKYHLSYDAQNRISEIVADFYPKGADISTPLWTSTFEYGNNSITVTKTGIITLVPEDGIKTLVTKYETNGSQVVIDGSKMIDIDDKGRALIDNFKYDNNGNVASFDHHAWGNRTAEYDGMNGVFRCVSIPSWYMTTQLGIMERGLNLYNNCTKAAITEYIGKERAPAYGYIMDYNTDDYPTKIVERQINIISNGYANWEVEYISAN